MNLDITTISSLILVLFLLIPKLAENSIYIKMHFIFEDMEKIGLFNDFTGRPDIYLYRRIVREHYGVFRWFYNKRNNNYKNDILYKKANGDSTKFLYLMLQHSFCKNGKRSYEIFSYCEKRIFDELGELEHKIMFSCLEKIVNDKSFEYFKYSSDFHDFLSSYICTMFPNEYPNRVSLKRMKGYIENWRESFDSKVANDFFSMYEKEIDVAWDKLQ